MVEAAVAFSGGTPKGVRVIGPGGTEVPAQLTASGHVLFLASVPSVGFAVFDVQATDAVAAPARSALSVSESSLENARYRLQIDRNGDIGSLFDKMLNKELLSAPARLEIKTDNPRNWPAWNMDYDQEIAPPRAFVSGPARVRGWRDESRCASPVIRTRPPLVP